MRMPPRGKGQRKPMTGQAVHKEHQEKTSGEMFQQTPQEQVQCTRREQLTPAIIQ